MADSVRMVSDSLGQGLARIFRAGGLALTFLYVGGVLMLSSSMVSATVISYVLAGVGFLLIVIVGIFFYAKEIRPITQAQRLATREKQAIDSIQMAAIDLTKILRSLQALALKNADDVIGIVDKVDEIRPYVRLIPKVGSILDSSPIWRGRELSRLIIDTTRGSEKVITDVQNALISADAKSLQPYLLELRQLAATIDELLVSRLRVEFSEREGV